MCNGASEAEFGERAANFSKTRFWKTVFSLADFFPPTVRDIDYKNPNGRDTNTRTRKCPTERPVKRRFPIPSKQKFKNGPTGLSVNMTFQLRHGECWKSHGAFGMYAFLISPFSSDSKRSSTGIWETG